MNNVSLPDFGQVLTATGTTPIYFWGILHNPKIFPYESENLIAITGVPQVFSLDPPSTALFQTHHLLTLELTASQVIVAMRFLRTLETDGAILYPRPDQAYDDQNGRKIVPLRLEATPLPVLPSLVAPH